MPLQPHEPHLQCDRKVAKESKTTDHNRLLLDALLRIYNVDSSGNKQDTRVYLSNMSWQADLYFSDGSGGSHSPDAELRRVDWGTAS